MLRSIIGAGCLLVGFSTVAAAQLGPGRPSDLVELSSTSATCPLFFPNKNALAIDRINLPDGSTAPFVIPPQHVFIVTSVQLSAQLVPAGKRFNLSLFRVNKGQFGGLIVNSYGTSTGGAVSTHVTIPHGAVVKRGTPLCMVVINLDAGPEQPSPEGVIHGYFARDR